MLFKHLQTSVLLAVVIVGAHCCDYNTSKVQNQPHNNNKVLSLTRETTQYENTSVIGSHLRHYIYSDTNLKMAERYLHHFNKVEKLGTKSFNMLQTVNGKLMIIVFNDLFMHRYDSITDIKLSSGPEVNQELCLSHLKHLNERANQFRQENSNSTDIATQRLLDTFGRVSAGYFSGRVLFTGAYLDCLTIEYAMPKEDVQSMRYCYAKLKHQNWTQGNPMDEFIHIKTGICLPKSCNALNYKSKFKQVEELLYLNDVEFKNLELQVDDLYCLPDEDSPIRQWWKVPKTRLMVISLTIWLTLLTYSTYRNQSDFLPKEKQSSSSSSLRGKNNNFYAALSLVRNFRKLIRTQTSATISSPPKPDSNPRVNFKFLDGIKVLSSVYIFLGHTQLWTLFLVWNGTEQVNSVSFGYYAPYIVPAFAVNTFFVVTSMLTTYMVFKANESIPFITSPIKWLALIIYRYMRVMPTYLVVTLLAKHVLRFLGSGPFWDYGTSSLGTRRACENESILWTLLFGANLKTPFDSCLPPGWSLANDFQFFLVMPILVPMLYWSPKLAQNFIKLCIALGSLASFKFLMSLGIDYRPAVKFEVYGFKYQMSYIADTYTFPQYRIPSYLMGILFGYTVYKSTLEEQTSSKMVSQSEGEKEEVTGKPRIIWPEIFIKYGPRLSLLLILLCSTLPVILSRITFSSYAARFIFSLIMPVGHLIFSWAVGSYILLAATGYGNKLLNEFLSHPFWKPLARLSLCVVLVNMEVIQYFVQSYSELQAFNSVFLISSFLLSTIVTYMVSTVLYITIEAPIRNLLSLAISQSLTMEQLIKKKKD